MRYGNVLRGTFVRRLNRFAAEAAIGGRIETVHVKNTGRLKELLVPGAEVSLETAANAGRKTRHSLIAVRHGGRWVNIDSQAPNAVVAEALAGGFLDGLGRIGAWRREAAWGHSRFDFWLESEGRSGYMEVKGVTLERDGVALFPDAPTARGTKHLLELAEAAEQGHLGVVLFLIQMKGCRLFKPHEAMDAAFAGALRDAAGRGVQVLAFDALVTEAEIAIGDPVEVAVG